MTFHPALPLLAGLGVAGLLLGLRYKKEVGLAWGALAIAGMALLAPALSIPTGIPSPAATLAAVPPWQGTGDPAEGNPILRDVTFQIQPWQIFARREMRAGRLPLWNPHQFSGAPFWSNGQSAPLFPLHLLFDALPLQLGFVLLPWLRLLIAGCGAWVLGRELGLSRPAALLTALTFSLSGMMVSFLLFPMGNALALVPWVLWAVEKERVFLLALLAGLQLLGGHPETSAHTALLSAIYLLVRGASLASWGRFALGWIGAALIAAVQILPLALLLPENEQVGEPGRWGRAFLRAPSPAASPAGPASALRPSGGRYVVGTVQLLGDRGLCRGPGAASGCRRPCPGPRPPLARRRRDAGFLFPGGVSLARAAGCPRRSSNP